MLLRRVGADRLDFPPGHGWAYSNVGYLLVRGLLEDAVGEELGGARRRLVFEPLGVPGVRLARTLAAFAPVEDQAVVERAVLAL